MCAIALVSFLSTGACEVLLHVRGNYQVGALCGARSTSLGWREAQPGTFQSPQQLSAAHRGCTRRYRIRAIVLGNVVVITLEPPARNPQCCGELMQLVQRLVTHHVAPLLVAEPPMAVVNQNHVSVAAAARPASPAGHGCRCRTRRRATTHRGKHRQATLCFGAARARRRQRCLAHGAAQFESRVTRCAAVFVHGHAGSVGHPRHTVRSGRTSHGHR